MCLVRVALTRQSFNSNNNQYFLFFYQITKRVMQGKVKGGGIQRVHGDIEAVVLCLSGAEAAGCVILDMTEPKMVHQYLLGGGQQNRYNTST